MGEQHFLQDLEPHRRLISRLPLEGRTVLDFGMGHGELTALLLETDAARVIGYELDKSLPNLEDPRLEVVLGDFLQADVPEGAAVVANPPYSTIPELLRIFEQKGIEDVVLMVPERFDAFNYELAFVLPGTAFTPPARGSHRVLLGGKFKGVSLDGA